MMRIDSTNSYQNMYAKTQSSTDPTTTPMTTPKSAQYETYTPSSAGRNAAMNGIVLDKGTAAETTIRISRGDYDKILNAAVNNSDKPLEFGVDMEKRWVVIDGQRFECDLTAEEKRIRREYQKTLIDYIQEAEEKNKKDNEKTTKTEDIKSAYLTKRYGSPDATPDADDLVLKILKIAGIA